MKPEEKAEIILWDWLKTSDGRNIKEIYFNRINKLNAPIFRVEGKSKKIPDFIFSFVSKNGIKFVVVEIKNNEKSMNVQDSQKIINYYTNYFLKKTKYFIKDKKIKISCFLVATNDSPKGHLFKNEEKTGYQDNKEDHESLLKYNLFPRFEFQRTHDFMRSLTSNFKNLRKELNIKEEAPSLGILISNPKIDNNPHIQIIKFLDKSLFYKKSQWGQKFWRL